MSIEPSIFPPAKSSFVAIEAAVLLTMVEDVASTYVFVAASPPNAGSFRFVIEL